MELYHLESFIAVHRSGSLSKAALLRHISLPGISKHIKQLEEDLGFALFTRSARGMDLTGQGRQALAHAEEILQAFDRLRNLATDIAPIRIGLNIAPEFIELSRLKSEFANRFPGSETEFISHNSHVLLERLAAGDLDLCLAFGTVPEHFGRLPVRRVRMPLMIPVSIAETDDLGSQCWIVNTATCPFRIPVSDFWAARDITPRATLLAQDLSRRELVAQGLGIGFLEPQDCLVLMKSGRARQHPEHAIEIDLWLVMRKDRSAAVAGFLQSYLQQRYDHLDASLLAASPPGSLLSDGEVPESGVPAGEIPC